MEMYQEAISLFCDMGRFANAAKLEKEIAEMYENDNQAEKCVEHYKQAANYFRGEDSVSGAQIYESVAQACLEKNVLKFNAKGYLFNAGILHLCEGVATVFEDHM